MYRDGVTFVRCKKKAVTYVRTFNYVIIISNAL